MKLRALFIAVILAGNLMGQDNHYSQFYANKLYLNPAFAGSDICPRVILSFRDQWPGLAGEFVSYSATYDQTFSNTGIGFIFNGDDAGNGILKTNNFNLVFSPKVKLDHNWTLSFALSAGVVQKYLNHEKLLFPNQVTPIGINNEPQEITSDINRITPDISSGALLYSNNLYAGYSVHHILQPNNILLGPEGVLYRRHTVHAGMNFLTKGKGRNKTVVSPQVIFQKQGPHQELNLGMYVKQNILTGGIWYRGEDAIILLVGLQGKKMNFGFSYDLTISKLSTNTLGAFELSATYKFKCRTKSRIPRADCPGF